MNRLTYLSREVTRRDRGGVPPDSPRQQCNKPKTMGSTTPSLFWRRLRGLGRSTEPFAVEVGIMTPKLLDFDYASKA